MESQKCFHLRLTWWTQLGAIKLTLYVTVKNLSIKAETVFKFQWMALTCTDWRRKKLVLIIYRHWLMFSMCNKNIPIILKCSIRLRYVLGLSKCCRNLVISGSDDVKVLYQESLGLYKLHQTVNKRNAYQIPNSTLMFNWVSEHQSSRVGWSVSQVQSFRISIYPFREVFTNLQILQNE